jgi:hypothetical protein
MNAHRRDGIARCGIIRREKRSHDSAPQFSSVVALALRGAAAGIYAVVAKFLPVILSQAL